MHNYYAVIQSKILMCRRLNSTEKLLVAIISNLSNEKGYCFASNKYLGECLGLSVAMVRKCVASLEDKKVLVRVLKLNHKMEVEIRSLVINPDADILNNVEAPKIPITENDDTPATMVADPLLPEYHTPCYSGSTPPATMVAHNNKLKNKEEYSFAHFWDLYDKKTDRKQAEGYWNKMSEQDKILAVEKMDNHKAGREKKFWKDAIRYLRDRRWEDEPIGRAAAPQRKPNPELDKKW